MGCQHAWERSGICSNVPRAQQSRCRSGGAVGASVSDLSPRSSEQSVRVLGVSQNDANVGSGCPRHNSPLLLPPAFGEGSGRRRRLSADSGARESRLAPNGTYTGDPRSGPPARSCTVTPSANRSSKRRLDTDHPYNAGSAWGEGGQGSRGTRRYACHRVRMPAPDFCTRVRCGRNGAARGPVAERALRETAFCCATTDCAS